MKLSLLGAVAISGRLVNLMSPVDHYLNFSAIAPEWVKPEDYRVVIITYPQFRKYNEAHGGDGTRWELDQDHMVQFCREVNSMNPLPAFITFIRDLAQATPHTPGITFKIRVLTRVVQDRK